MTWRKEAACRGQGTRLFYNRRTPDERDQAKAICQSCPVRRECLDYVLDHESKAVFRAGVWGGMTALERSLESEVRNDHSGS
jgi:WhiB family redox-sensing transcriptional regulator